MSKLPSITAAFRRSPASCFSLDLGATVPVQRGKGEIVVNATDVLNTNQATRTIRGRDFQLVSTDYLETQVVRVGHTRKF